MEIILKAKNIYKNYPGVTALDNVSFNVYKGKVNVLVGENGAGKSTLMKILAGVEKQTSGDMILKEKILNINSTKDAEKNSIGIIHQELNLFPNLSVHENIFMGHEIFNYLTINTKKQKEITKNLMRKLNQNIKPDDLNNKNTFAIEGSIFVAGAGVQWLRDKIRLINNAYETEKIAKSKENNNDLYIVPAFTGLGAPYWSPSSRGLITGLTRNSDWKDMVRAVLESVA